VGYVPTVHESIARGNMLVGSPSEVAERLAEIVDVLGVEEMAI
jgi:alkanesulfonate monooxygenase SsuD/methylene tetrahydromethanopterin reductase-like flavin-dependent oxidoreductase (luciferase family)